RLSGGAGHSAAAGSGTTAEATGRPATAQLSDAFCSAPRSLRVAGTGAGSVPPDRSGTGCRMDVRAHKPAYPRRRAVAGTHARAADELGSSPRMRVLAATAHIRHQPRARCGRPDTRL